MSARRPARGRRRGGDGGGAARRRAPLARRIELALAVLCAAVAATIWLGALASRPATSAAQGAGPTGGASAPGGGAGATAAPGGSRARLIAEGRRLFLSGCSSCHGDDARGIPGTAPSLRGVGAASADFYVRTGRMPLQDPHDQPQRKESFYDAHEIDALVAYVGSFGGPPIPRVDPAAGDLAEGLQVFGEQCAGCHQIVGRGGITTGAWIPGLQDASAVDVAEALTIGPYVMPSLRSQLTARQVDSLARYVLWTRQPDDVGGWGIGHIGPVPEGMVAWLLAGTALLLTIRLIGERTTR